MNIRLITYLFVFILGNFCHATIYTFNNNELSELLLKAENLVKNEEYNYALDVYNKALKIVSKEQRIDDASYIYNKIGVIYYKQRQYEKAKSNFKASILKSNRSQDAANSYFKLTLIYRKQKAKDSLLWSLAKSLDIYNELEDDNAKFTTYSKAGILYKQLGMYDKAISYLLLAYDGLDNENGASIKASVCYTIGETQRLLGNYDIAKTYLNESLQLRRVLKDTLKISYANNNLGNLFKDLKQYDSATVYYKKAIELQKNLKTKKEIGKMLNNLAGTYFLMEELDLAFQTYQKALQLKRTEKDTLSLPYTFNELALVSIKRKNQKMARMYLDSSKRYLNTISKKETWLRYYEIESEYHAFNNNYKKTHEFQGFQFQLYKELFSEAQTQTIQTLQEQFESQLKEQQISQLTLDNNEKDSTIVLQNERIKDRNLILALLSIVLIIFIGVYFYLKQRQKIKIQILENQKLKEVLEGQEIIKDHISKDLHDMIPTSYDAIRLKVLALAKAKEPEKVSQSIIEDIRVINHQVRLISHRLSPLGNKIKNSSLTEIIASYFSEFQHYRQVFIDVQLPLPKELNSMTLNAQTHVYGIILEVFNNIEKHAKATKISVQHSITDNNQIIFKICDDGIGFKEHSSEGIGLINIKQRIQLLNGEFKIESDSNGTCIKWGVPILSNLK